LSLNCFSKILTLKNEAEENSCPEYLHMLRKHYRKATKDWKTRKDSNPINKYTIIPYNTLEESERTFSPVRSRTPHMPHIRFASFGISSVRPTLFTTTPQKPIQSSPMPLLHSVTRHRLPFSFGRNMPPASSSLASSHTSHTCIHFVHNLYTKNRTAANNVSNLHPCWQHAGTQNTAKKL